MTGRRKLTHEDFLSRVRVREDGCWEYVGPRDHKGYGFFGARTRAHTYSYRHYVGPIPEGWVLDHFKCDWPPCVNYEHLRPVTQVENTLRGNSPMAVNRRKTECPKCGGEYEISTKGRRFCRACRNERKRRSYRAAWREL